MWYFIIILTSTEKENSQTWEKTLILSSNQHSNAAGWLNLQHYGFKKPPQPVTFSDKTLGSGYKRRSFPSRYKNRICSVLQQNYS